MVEKVRPAESRKRDPSNVIVIGHKMRFFQRVQPSVLHRTKAHTAYLQIHFNKDKSSPCNNATVRFARQREIPWLSLTSSKLFCCLEMSNNDSTCTVKPKLTKDVVCTMYIYQIFSAKMLVTTFFLVTSPNKVGDITARNVVTNIFCRKNW